MAVQRAAFEKKVAPLSTEFGRKVAVEKFGEQTVAAFPTFSRGPRKGQLKGFLCWTKCAVGGWTHDHPDSPGRSGVVRPGTSHWRLAVAHPDADPCGHSIVARWTYNSGSPIVENLQTPQAAEELHKAYGSNKRYA
jgi:hypothetical protein